MAWVPDNLFFWQLSQEWKHLSRHLSEFYLSLQELMNALEKQLGRNSKNFLSNIVQIDFSGGNFAQN